MRSNISAVLRYWPLFAATSFNLFGFSLGVALPDQGIQSREDFYSQSTSTALQHIEKRALIPWHPADDYVNATGYYTFWQDINCSDWVYPGTTVYTGILVKAITWYTSGGLKYSYWHEFQNSYYIDLPRAQRNSPGQCNLFSQGFTNQCNDTVYTNYAYNAAYGASVRTIWDCLLNQTVIDYQNNHPVFNHRPVRYTLTNQNAIGWTYYRFYDLNNFAWFVGCPPPGTQITKRGAAKGPGYNPWWDFNSPSWRLPYADGTPLAAYNIPGYKSNAMYTSHFWPVNKNRFVTVDGVQCLQMAASRPGLRHWTAIFFLDGEDEEDED